MTRATHGIAVVAALLVTLLAGAVSTEQPVAPTAKPEDGIPVTDATVQKACGTCHRPDDKSQMSRISFQRNTPEGWQSTIQRMAALNGLKIDPQTARQVVKYLSNHLGLAPEEAKPAACFLQRDTSASVVCSTMKSALVGSGATALVQPDLHPLYTLAPFALAMDVMATEPTTVFFRQAAAPDWVFTPEVSRGPAHRSLAPPFFG